MLPTPTTNSSPPTSSVTGLGLAMLLVGMVIGYLIHPILATLIAPVPLTQGTVPPSAEARHPTATPDTTEATQAAAIMDAVVARTRHFKGDPAAPVILIEFGDYQ